MQRRVAIRLRAHAADVSEPFCFCDHKPWMKVGMRAPSNAAASLLGSLLGTRWSLIVTERGRGGHTTTWAVSSDMS